MRTLIITGAGRGIGAATARLAARSGYAVCVNYRRDRDAADGVVGDIRLAGGRAIAVQADISIPDEVNYLFQRSDAELGLLAALVNNAGVLAHQSRLEHMTDERIFKTVSVNFIGSMLCAREAIKRMSIRNGGKGGGIVSISTGFVRYGAPGRFLDYASSKSAIETMTLGLAKEVAADGIRVNAVRPGLIDTEMHADGGDPDKVHSAKDLVPMKRAGQPAEVAQAILWLLSDEASYTTGTVVDVSGGL